MQFVSLGWQRQMGSGGGAGAPSTPQYALSFDGVDDYAIAAARLPTMEPSGDFTLAARYRFDGSFVPSTIPTVGGNTSNSWRLSIRSNAFSANEISGDARLNTVSVNANSPFATGSGWRETALIRSGTNLFLYVDGTRYGPTTVSSAAISDASMRPIIGSQDAGGQGRFTGLVSRMAYWDSALTDAALDDYFAGAGDSQSPVHAWPINEGSGSILTDTVASVVLNITGATWVQL